MTLVGDSVTPRMTAAEMAPGARGRKPVVSMMQEIRSQSLFSLEIDHLQEIVVIPYP